MYQHFQDYPIDDFNDAVSIARIIAKEIGREFTEPRDPEEFKVTSSDGGALPPDGLELMQIERKGSSAPSDGSYGISTIELLSPKPIFNLSAVTSHPEVYVSPLKPLYKVGSDKKEELSLRVVWAKRAEPPLELEDSYQRRFTVQRPLDPGPPWQPLYITFQTQSGQLWAAVAYMKVELQQRGYPETQILPGPNPYGWVRGQKPRDQ